MEGRSDTRLGANMIYMHAREMHLASDFYAPDREEEEEEDLNPPPARRFPLGMLQCMQFRALLGASVIMGFAYLNRDISVFRRVKRFLRCIEKGRLLKFSSSFKIIFLAFVV